MAFVLVVGTNETIAARVSDALIGAGHACGWVATVPKAAALLHWRAPDLILLDEAMPGADGALPQMLRETARSPDLPLILLTGRAGAEPGRGGLVAGHLPKAFDPRYLVWHVNHVLEAHRGRPLFFEDGWAGQPAQASARGAAARSHA